MPRASAAPNKEREKNTGGVVVYQMAGSDRESCNGLYSRYSMVRRDFRACDSCVILCLVVPV